MIRSALGLAFTFMLAGGVAGCSSNDKSGAGSGGSMNMKSSATMPAAYACSMHPEVKSDKPGTCPKSL
jgi:hypothetical protein